MITFVCLCNLTLTLINVLVAWRVWKYRRVLASMTRTLTEVEQTAHLLLAPAPSLILKGQGETRRLSDRLQKLRRLLQQTLSVYSIVMLGYRVWQRRSQRI